MLLHRLDLVGLYVESWLCGIFSLFLFLCVFKTTSNKQQAKIIKNTHTKTAPWLDETVKTNYNIFSNLFYSFSCSKHHRLRS
jgi:hypothetical protein